MHNLLCLVTISSNAKCASNNFALFACFLPLVNHEHLKDLIFALACLFQFFQH